MFFARCSIKRCCKSFCLTCIRVHFDAVHAGWSRNIKWSYIIRNAGSATFVSTHAVARSVISQKSLPWRRSLPAGKRTLCHSSLQGGRTSLIMGRTTVTALEAARSPLRKTIWSTIHYSKMTRSQFPKDHPKWLTTASWRKTRSNNCLPLCARL